MKVDISNICFTASLAQTGSARILFNYNYGIKLATTLAVYNNISALNLINV